MSTENNKMTKTQFLKSVAEMEEGERLRIITEKVEEVKKLLKDRYSYTAIPDYDQWIGYYLLYRKFDVERTLEMLVKFINLYYLVPNVARALNPEETKAFFDERNAFFLNHKDSRGRRVLIARITESSTKDPDATLAALVMLISDLQYNPFESMEGILVLVDLNGWDLKCTRFATISRIKAIVAVYQDASPLRVSEIHIFNSPFLFRAVWSVASQFLTQKNRKKINFHGKISRVAADMMGPGSKLPQFMGGEASVNECVDFVAYERVHTAKKFFMGLEEQAKLFLKNSGKQKFSDIG